MPLPKAYVLGCVDGVHGYHRYILRNFLSIPGYGSKKVGLAIRFNLLLL